MNKLSVSAPSAFLSFICYCYRRVGTQPPAPKAGREHAKLAYFARKWVSEAEVKPSAFGPGGKFTFTESCEWLPGKSAILCQSKGNMMGGEYHGLSVMSYDTAEKSYIYYETNNWGENICSQGSVDGDTWTWTNHSEMNGKTVRGHSRIRGSSPSLGRQPGSAAFAASNRALPCANPARPSLATASSVPADG